MLPVLVGQPAGLVGVDGLCTTLGLGLACLVVLGGYVLLRPAGPGPGLVLRLSLIHI